MVPYPGSPYELVSLDNTYFARLPKDIYPLLIPFYSSMCYEPQVASWDEIQAPTGLYNWMDVLYMLGPERFEWVFTSHITGWVVTERLIL